MRMAGVNVYREPAAVPKERGRRWGVTFWVRLAYNFKLGLDVCNRCGRLRKAEDLEPESYVALGCKDGCRNAYQEHDWPW